MQFSAFVALLLLCGSSLAQARTSNDDSESPVTRVVKLLTDMRSQVDSEAKADEEAYKKYECWCKNGKKEKTAAVEVAQEAIAGLEASIEKAAGLEAQLKTEIEDLTSGIAADEESLEKAAALRAKENEEFLAVEAEMNETLATLKEAIAVLAKVQLMQKKHRPARAAAAEQEEVQPLLMQLRQSLKSLAPRVGKYRSVMQQDLWDMLSTIKVEDISGDGDDTASAWNLRASPRARGLSALERQAPMEAGEDKPTDLEGNAAGARSFNARSGSIYGMLVEMKDEFSRDLASAQKSEAAALASFTELKAAKLGEIASATAQKKQKEQSLAATVAQAAQDKEDVEATTSALSADEQVLLTLDKTCKEEMDEYASRSKARTEEMTALSEAIAILTTDNARDLFGKTVSKTLSLLQMSSKRTAGTGRGSKAAAAASTVSQTQAKAVESAVRKVLQTARRNKDWSLATLAVRMSLDPFTKVKEVMDKMLAQLKAQQKEESEKHEFCKAQIDETEDTIKVKNIEKGDLEDKKLGLENSISTLESDIKELNTEVAELQVALKHAGEDRKAENMIFQKAISENRETAAILKKAISRLEKYYMPNTTTLTQTKAKQEPGARLAAPPPKPSDYQKSGGAGGVLQLLSQIVNDVQRSEAQLIVDEQSSQKGYEAFARDTNAAVEAKRAAVTEKTKIMESAKGEHSSTAEALLANGAELESLGEALAGMHADCDFLLKYYKVRQQARQEEMGAIVEAKAILSGADFSTAEDEADEVAAR